MADAPGPLIVDIAGVELDGEDRELLRHPLVGGLILFTRNYESRRQLVQLCKALHALRPRCPLLITVDQEGGRVQRFRDGFTVLPPAADLGAQHAVDADAALVATRRHGRLLATELLDAGVDMSFAPVLDVGRGLGAVIGDRALAEDADAVSVLGSAWIAGMHEAGMAACAKHFPGHGGVAADSHDELPVDPRGFDEIGAADLIPFRGAIAAGIDSVMMAHVAYPAVDERPASLSRHWIMDVLRGSLGFGGVVICDDLNMAGAAFGGSYPDRAQAALEAGCDLLPVCNRRAGAIEIVDNLRPRADHARGERIARLRPRREGR